jgi:hypothetical protein
MSPDQKGVTRAQDLNPGRISLGEVRRARQQWIEAVEARDVEAVMALYDASEGVLQGTMDTKATGRREGADRIRDYFEHFLANDRVVVGFPEKIKGEDLVALGPGRVAYYGFYEFTLEKDGQRKVAHAKFTFIYERGENGLVIKLHNSGLTPEGIEELS